MGLGKFWPDLEISEALLMAFEDSFSSDFYVLESRICRFLFPFGLQESKFSEITGIAYRTEPCRIRLRQ